MLSVQSFAHYKSKPFKFILLILGLGISVLVYLPGLPGDFVHDDLPNIVQNKKLHLSNLDLSSIVSASLSSQSGLLKRPISMFTLALNYYISELNPLSYKIFNITIHVLVGLSLFILSNLLLNNYKKLSNIKISRQSCFYISLATAIAWLVSPINLTTVLYIVQRMTSLSALFSVIGLCFYVVARQSMIFQKKLNYISFLIAGIFFVIAIFCKENAILNFLYLICIELFIFRFASNSTLSTKSFRLIFLTLAITPVVFLVIWLAYDPSNVLKVYEFRSFTLLERVFTQARVLLYYLKWIIAPNITELGLFHDDMPISRSLLDPFTTLLSMISICFLLAASFFFKKTMPLLSFGILFFFSSHILESSVIPLEMMYEHRNYLASFGVIFGIIASIFYIVKNTSTKNLAILIYCLWFCAISITTYIRSSQWEDAVTHAFYEVDHHPKSPRANFRLGSIYANLAIADVFDEKGQAISLFEKSMQHMPYEIAAESAAIIFSSAVNIESKPDWSESIVKKLDTYPITPITIESFREINKCLSLKCNIDNKQVFEFYQAALSNTNNVSNTQNSDLLSLYAEFCANNLGEFDIAYHAMSDAIKASPHVLQYRINLITLLIAMKRHDEASFHIDYVENNDTFHLQTKALSILKNKLIKSKNNVNA